MIQLKGDKAEVAGAAMNALVISANGENCAGGAPLPKDTATCTKRPPSALRLAREYKRKRRCPG